ncbi:Nucleolar RNA helicase 2 [Takifugu flavidus]|uniref:RNA helicase n=1 Tax=Takifugu flavidus TaxID=433684 RepID=A0A5C6NMC6_9TELE|nr:Nucleolar RNA helicase 2 [Takifugu flavidus]
MPSKVFFETEDQVMEEVVDIAADVKTPKNKSKDGMKLKKKQKTKEQMEQEDQDSRGVSYLFDIQVKTFDSVYDGEDVIAQARTGTGKTFSFAIPLVEKLQRDSAGPARGRAPKVLVLTPTRELAIQVAKDFKDIIKKLSIVCFYGGTSYMPQKDQVMEEVVDIAADVKTPKNKSKDGMKLKKKQKTKEQMEQEDQDSRGVSYLFDIQVKTFDSVYDGEDVIAQARTGTGKTFSFAIPLVEKLQRDSAGPARGRAPKVLVLTPTRELAIQVAKDFKDIIKKLSIVCFYGGTSYMPQIDAIRNGIDILVGTPGRIKDHLQNNKLDLSKLKHVVLDEVDQMLDMGFAEQVEEILASSYKKALAIACHWSQRAAVIGDVIQVYSGSHGRTIVFCETKKEANELSMNASIKQSTQSLHGDIPQKQRETTLKGFRNGSFEVLVATNVAARGLDIPEVDLVVQCSPPKDVESYIHRSGRTGRAGRTGVCICFYQRKEEDQLRYVENKAGITFRRVGVPTANDIIKSSSKDAVRFLDSIPVAAIGYFRASAEKLIEERGAVDALAAALAHISGATALEQRSLLNSDAHLAIACHWSQRAAVIGDVIQVYSGSHGRTIVFCETKKEANELSMNASIKQSTQSLHGDIPQKQRETTLKGFRNGSFEVLVATNVAARGLDIPEVDLVVQCSPPKDVESYIHRSGRTGRAGRTGVCICFYQRKEEDQLRYVENKAGITFRRVGVPTANDIIKSSSKDAVRFLDSIPVAAIGYFRASAEKLIEERGAVDALAAALAHISGATALEQRSLLNSDAGYTTLQLTCSLEMHNIGYAWKSLKEQLGEEIETHIHRMTFLKGRMENWKDGRRWQLTVATELPELEVKEFTNGFGRGGGGRGGRGGRGGFRGGRGRSFGGFRNGNNRGGQRRSFSQAFDY